MNSHDLARYLLSHRANDIRIEVLVDIGEAEELLVKRTELRDHTEGGYSESYTIPSNSVIAYDSLADVIVIKAGNIIILSKEEMERFDAEL